MKKVSLQIIFSLICLHLFGQQMVLNKDAVSFAKNDFVLAADNFVADILAN